MPRDPIPLLEGIQQQLRAGFLELRVWSYPDPDWTTPDPKPRLIAACVYDDAKVRGEAMGEELVETIYNACVDYMWKRDHKKEKPP